MKKIAIICSFNTIKSKRIAQIIADTLGSEKAVLVNAENITTKEFMSYDKYILSIPTWFYGELPNYWDEFIPALEEQDLSGKTFAIYGLGDQKKYPYNFVDAIGMMGQFIEDRGGKTTGHTPNQDYTFIESKALRSDGLFWGLPLDDDNEAEKTEKRLNTWLEGM